MMISDNLYRVEDQTNHLMSAEQTLFFWTMSQIKGQGYYYYKFLYAAWTVLIQDFELFG